MTCRAEVSGPGAAFLSVDLVYVLPLPYGGSVRIASAFTGAIVAGVLPRAAERKGHSPIKSV